MNKNSKILITGSHGMVGKSIIKKLKADGYNNLLTPPSHELDLRNQKETEKYFSKNKVEFIFHLAAKVGGIRMNIRFPAIFLYDNLMIELNMIEFSRKYNVKKLLFLSSSCVYPRECKQPMKEEYLLSGKLEPTNESYALAKISGLKLCEYYNKQYGTNFISLMACNLYGPNDNFDPLNSHFIAGLIRKFHEAKINNKDEVVLWGTGNPQREVMFVDDLTEACIFLMQNYDSSEIINVGTGEDKTIKEFAELIKEIVGFSGNIAFDSSKPDGITRKLLDISKMNNMGWKAKTDLKKALKLTYEWFLENVTKKN